MSVRIMIGVAVLCFGLVFIKVYGGNNFYLLIGMGITSLGVLLIGSGLGSLKRTFGLETKQ